MHSPRREFWLALTAVVALAAVAGPWLEAQRLTAPLRFSAVAMDLDRELSTPLRIIIDRWSTDQTNDKLVDVMMNKGSDRLLEALQNAPRVGSIGTPTSLAWDLHFARQFPGEDGGTRIVLGTDRPIAFSEQWNSSRTLDYPFTIIELHVNDDGEGEGTLSFATKVMADARNKSVVLENWGTQRVRLTQVRKESAR